MTPEENYQAVGMKLHDFYEKLEFLKEILKNEPDLLQLILDRCENEKEKIMLEFDTAYTEMMAAAKDKYKR